MNRLQIAEKLRQIAYDIEHGNATPCSIDDVPCYYATRELTVLGDTGDNVLRFVKHGEALIPRHGAPPVAQNIEGPVVNNPTPTDLDKELPIVKEGAIETITLKPFAPFEVIYYPNGCDGLMVTTFGQDSLPLVRPLGDGAERISPDVDLEYIVNGAIVTKQDFVAACARGPFYNWRTTHRDGNRIVKITERIKTHDA